MADPGEIAVSDPVRFRIGGRMLDGHVARKAAGHCIVVSIDGRAFKAPWPSLDRRGNAPRKRVATPTDRVKAEFHAGDAIEFPTAGGNLAGRIARMLPRNAEVVASDGRTYRVPYHLLGRPDAGLGQRRAALLESVAAEAERLMERHGLAGWSFQYDDASRRAGACHYQTRVISMAQSYCVEATAAERTDTILHEIAHALAGPEHHHDDVWKSIALSIGCNGERCHDVEFTPPKYIVSCPACGWVQKRRARRRNLVCRTCGGPVRVATDREAGK